MKKMVLDIETVGEDFDRMDETTREIVTRWTRKEAQSEKELKVALEELKSGMGFSPLTGEIAVIGTLDCDENKGAVYYQAPGEKLEDFNEDGLVFRAMSEKEMLLKFWEIATHYGEFVTFNGRGFDVPFMVIRSAIHDIRPTKDLMSNRYLGSQRQAARHIDLQDQLSFYGSVRRKGNLHLWARAFGIKSPKAEGVSGDMVTPMFRAKKYADIARYNAGDLRATKELYHYWDKYIRA